MSDSVKSHVIVNAATTSTSEATATGVHTSDTRYYSLYILWTPGAASNVLTITREDSPSESHVADADAVWVQDQTMSTSGGTYTRTLQQIQHTATGTDQVGLRFDFTVNAKRMRIKYSETVSAGTLTAYLVAKSE